MKLRFPLLPKILAWFFLNLVVLGAGFFFVLKVQFRFGLDSLLAGRVGERIQAVQRRFLRMIEDARLQIEGFNLVHTHSTCTGCRNGVMSSLFDLKKQGLLDHVRGLTIFTGDGEPPKGVIEDNLLVVGVCCPRELKRSRRYVKGCPPNNIDIVQAIMEGRQMRSPYATE